MKPPGEYIDDPTGYLESVRGGRGSATVTGWATHWDAFVGSRITVPADRGETGVCVAALDQYGVSACGITCSSAAAP